MFHSLYMALNHFISMLSLLNSVTIISRSWRDKNIIDWLYMTGLRYWQYILNATLNFLKWLTSEKVCSPMFSYKNLFTDGARDHSILTLVGGPNYTLALASTWMYA